MPPLRVLVVGDVNGEVTKLYKRVASVTKKSGNFDMLLVSGSFFSAEGGADANWGQYLRGELKVPIPTYILGPIADAQLPKFKAASRGGDLLENLTYLGQQGVYVMPSGLKLAYLSGTFNPATHALEDQPEPRIGYAKADVESLVGFASRPSYSGVDMLLTARWPAGVCAGATAPGDATAARSNCVGSAAAAAALRPRYHFAAGCSAFYERQPYSNAVVGQPPRPATRFFGVAAVGNAAKERWLYAFNVEPMSAIDPATLLVPPASLTPSPYAIGRPPPPPPAAVQNSFFFGQQGGGGHAGERKRRRVEGGNRAPRPPQPTGPCWFCLGGAEVEKHLVTAIGKTVYVALAKGGLTKDHVLVLPIKHVPSSLALDDETRAEITEYKQALRTYFEKQGKACVMWERNMRSQHLQIQVCPIPQDAAAAAETVFRERGEAMGPSFKWQVLTPGTPLAEMFDGGGDPPYFLVTLPDGTELLHRISSGFPLQFARASLAAPTLLDVPERVDWKACKEDKKTETAFAKEFQAAFKTFGPSFKAKAT